jgi:hypothetical protein
MSKGVYPQLYTPVALSREGSTIMQAAREDAENPTTITKHVIDLMPGDILIGRQGGHSVIEDSSDHSGNLGLMRIETEHGNLYMELHAEVKVLVQAKKK